MFRVEKEEKERINTQRDRIGQVAGEKEIKIEIG